MLDMSTGNSIRTLIPRGTEGDVITITLITKDDKYVVYYHAAKKSVRVFRISDGVEVGFHQSSVNINNIKDGQDVLVMGGIDGRVVVLVLADPSDPGSRDLVSQLPSRHPTASNKKPLKLKTVATVVKMANKANANKQSKMCAIS